MADFNQSPPNALSQLPESAQSAEIQSTNNNGGLTGLPQRSSSLDRERSRERQRDRAMSQSQTLAPSRGGTLKKRRSLSRKGSLKRDGSRKSSHPGTIRGQGFDGQEEVVANHASEMNSAFFTPVTTSGSPTEILATRFQGG